MAHWIDKKQKTRISDKDYNILSTGEKTTVGYHGEDNNFTFSQSPRDYIEMSIFTTRGTFLDSIRLDEPKKYMNANNEFDINPGIILRRNGYFSGEYDIEFNFFREIAGSNQNVLVDSNKEIYTGEYDVLIDGRIVEKETGEELEELDYKYYVHQISNDKKEVRLTTLPINNETYKREFEGLGEQSTVVYPSLEGIVDGTDTLKFKNPASNTDTEFTLDSNSNIKLDKSLIGGELIINDAFEIMDLSDLNKNNDGFSIGCPVVRGIGGSWAFESIRIGDKENGTGTDYFWHNCFEHIGADSNKKHEIEFGKLASEAKGNSGIPYLGGAYVVGYKTTRKAGGFPVEINTTIADLDKIKDLEPKLTTKLKGRDLVNTSRTFESTFSPRFTGNGTKFTVPVPTDHRTFGGLYDIEFNLTFDVNGTRRGFTVYRPNFFAVIPTRKEQAGDFVPAWPFIEAGMNY